MNVDFNSSSMMTIRKELSKCNDINKWCIGNSSKIEKYCIDYIKKNHKCKNILLAPLKFYSDKFDRKEASRIYKRKDLYIINNSDYIILFVSNYRYAIDRSRIINNKGKKSSYIFLPYKRK